MAQPAPSIRRRVSNLTRTLRLVWGAARGWTVAWGLILVLQGLLPAATVYLSKVLVDGLTVALGAGVSWEATAPVRTPALLLVGVLVASQILQAVGGWIRTAQAELVADYVKGLIHDQAAAVDLEYYETPAYFDQMARANGQAESRAVSILENLGALFQGALSLGAICLLLVPYGLWLPLALVVSALPALAVVVWHQRHHHDWWSSVTQSRRWASYYDLVLTGNIFAAEVRVFGLNERFHRAYQRVRRELRDGHLRLLRRRGIAQVGAGFSALLVTALTLLWVGWRALKGTATLGDLALFYQAFSQGQSLMRALLGNVGALYADALFLEHLYAFLELEPRTTSPPAPRALPPARARAIEIEGVSFRYPGSDALALRDFSLSIPAGATVAVVGPNGAGKSTLVKLLCRFYDPVAGSVRLDGVDIRELDVDALRARVTALFQHHVNYAGTVAENVAMGDPSETLSPGRFAGALRAGRAEDLVARLPGGEAQMLGKQFEGGLDLSGGEFQRLAIARAFYRDAEILLLDEPTSFMDPWSEALWLDRFRDHAGGRTVVVVTHRFSTARRADLICVVDQGRAVEVGTHDELVALDGLYAASWRTQSAPHVEEAAVPLTV